MMQEPKHTLQDEIAGVDFGAGALKVYSRWGGIELPSHVAFAGRRKRQARVSGLRTLTPPMQVLTGHGGFYLGSIGGPAALLAQHCIKKVEIVEYPELGMEAIWKIDVESFPAFTVVDDKGNDFFKNL